MKCKNCGFENMDGANFCVNCGTRLEKDAQEEKRLEETAARIEAEEEMEPVTVQTIIVEENPVPQKASESSRMEDNDNGQEAKWYYVENGTSQGPVSEQQLKQMLLEGRLNEQSYIWTPGMDDWTRVSKTLFEKSLKQPSKKEVPDYTYRKEDSIQNNPENHLQSEQWFYVENSRSTGPFNTQTMIALMENGTINAQTYVWKEGMGEWQHLENTSLKNYLPALPSAQNTSSQYHTGNPGYPNPAGGYYAANMMQEHSVILFILLSIVTCGIWYFIWVYILARDLNSLAQAQNKPKGPDPVLTVILILLSCSIYQIYFFWKAGTVLGSLKYRNYQPANQSVLLAVLAIFIPIASCAILQDQINTIIKYGN